MSASAKSRVNDFVIRVANVNGTGSASANSLLMKTIFRMGVPVTGKNFFPSNIQGLPTWYEIRVTKDAYLARSGDVDVMVAMNAQTYEKDLNRVTPGGVLIYDSTWPRDRMLSRSDITIVGIPLARICNEHFSNARARILMKNMAYVGALAALLDLDMEVIRTLVEETFAAKAKLVPANMEAIELGASFAREHYDCPFATRVEKLDKTAGHIMIDGNTAAGLGCVYAGATVGAWYPITPSTSVMDGFKTFCERLRVNKETGERDYCIIQAEDELAAIGIVLGASWNGARAFTPTSGPGISLMSEFLGFGYFAELPAVVFDVQRVGPSTGMPTRTQQADILTAAYASHGDTRHVLLFPSEPNECFELAVKAFDLADRLQTPVIVLLDLDIGMNDWMCKEFTWDDTYRSDRGKVLDAKALESVENFYRYLDSDGDGIPYRTYPGVHPKGAYFVRGSGHDKYGKYTEESSDYREVVDRLNRKFATAGELVPKPIIQRSKHHTDMAIVAVGSTDYAVREAIDRLASNGVHLNYMRIKAFPFSAEVSTFLHEHERVFVAEQNRDAQLKSLLTLETDYPKERMQSILHYGGLPMHCRSVIEAIQQSAAQGEAA
ncbi:MAG: 2-oxoacid:acceptor oxidoreductase subunit alpha [Gammaproteobacteria bacterium]|nr:2-oxoacid:acceptor oxidoreductase subunit alpha [Gammaproteobacteria bacterium]MDH3507449.1 2-oxoacid:acceptor oxidoreductase subunit alpha [Gammaproteobacteria bacterium]